MLSCYWKSNYGVDCFGCGFQRSVKLLSEGEFIASIEMYPALIPFIVTILYTLFHINIKFSNGAKNVIILFSITVSIMVINFLYKLF